MKTAARFIVFAVLLSMCFAGTASAQYMKLISDNSDPTKMKAAGTTVLTITLDTNHDKDASVQTCNSHTLATGVCGFVSPLNQPLTMLGYTITLSAVGGTVTWGSFTTAGSTTSVAYTDNGAVAPTTTQVVINFARASGVDAAGLYTLGSIPVTPTSGNPSIVIARGVQPIDLFGFGTGFGTECDGNNFPNTYVLADPADICNTGDWLDADGVGPAVGGANSTPIITAPLTAGGTEGTPLATLTATATDADAANTLTITQAGKPADLTFTAPSGVSPRTATITGTPGFADAGTYSIVWTVNDGAGGSASATTVLAITDTNQAPVITAPATASGAEGTPIATITATATDPDAANSLTIQQTGKPADLTFTAQPAGVSPRTATITGTPGFTDAGTYSIVWTVNDGTGTGNSTASATTLLTITNTIQNQNPVITAPATASGAEGVALATITATATDADAADVLTITQAGKPA